MFKIKKTVAGALAVAMIGGTVLTAAPAQAGSGYREGYRTVSYGPRYHHRARSNAAGALAVGLIGGLALGAIAANSAHAYPAYPVAAPAYPVAAPGYYRTRVYAAPECYTIKRRFVDDWGRTIVRKTRVCE